MGGKKEDFPTSQIFHNFNVPRIEKHLLSVLAILYLIFTLFLFFSTILPSSHYWERERERESKWNKNIALQDDIMDNVAWEQNSSRLKQFQVNYQISPLSHFILTLLNRRDANSPFWIEWMQGPHSSQTLLKVPAFWEWEKPNQVVGEQV